MNTLRFFSTAAVYGFAAFLLFCGIATLAWRVYPYPSGADDLVRTQIWLIHSLSEKCGATLLGCITSFLAARAYRPSWTIGVLTGILAALSFQIFSIALYLGRFGFHAYFTYHTFVRTMSSAIGLGGLFSFLAVWRQHRRESRNEA
jgi:hypothetical protein